MLMLCRPYCCGDCAQIAPPPCSVGIDGGSAMQRRIHELVSNCRQQPVLHGRHLVLVALRRRRLYEARSFLLFCSGCVAH